MDDDIDVFAIGRELGLDDDRICGVLEEEMARRILDTAILEELLEGAAERNRPDAVLAVINHIYDELELFTARAERIGIEPS
jgi:hypothetical protein